MTDSHISPGGASGRPGGIVYARTREGFNLPVIDVTNPHFTVPDDPAAVRRAHEDFLAEENRRRRIPAFIMRLMLRRVARKSRLVRALFQSDRSYLDSLSTYVLKLGAGNLVPPYDSPTDRRVAASPHILLIRLRMQQVAHLLAQGLAEDLVPADAAAPLHLVNIGGGPALDSINALIVLRRARPAVLDRPIAIEVFDANADPVLFGANALAALKAGGGPLAGLDVVLRHHDYNWDNPALLETLTGRLASSRGHRRIQRRGAVRVRQRSGYHRQPQGSARGRRRRAPCRRICHGQRRPAAAVDRPDRLQALSPRRRRLHAARRGGGVLRRQGRTGVPERTGAAAAGVRKGGLDCGKLLAIF